jgi:hypothetical protein
MKHGFTSECNEFLADATIDERSYAIRLLSQILHPARDRAYPALTIVESAIFKNGSHRVRCGPDHICRCRLFLFPPTS